MRERFEPQRNTRDRGLGPGQVLRRDQGRLTASTSPCPPARSTACSAPTAPARPRRSGCWRRCCAPTRARPACSGHDIVREADAVRSRVSLTGQLASVDEDLTGRENLVLLGRLLGLGRAGAKARADELLEAFGLTEAAGPPGQELLGRHAAAARHRRQHRRHPGADVPRRAHDRARPALAQPGLGHHPRARRRRDHVLLCTQYLDEADQLADGIAVIDRGKVIAEGTPGQLKASVGCGALHVRLARPRPARRGGADPGARRSTRASPRGRSRRAVGVRPTTPTAPPRRSPSCRARGSRSRTSRSASPASTRCSWP